MVMASFLSRWIGRASQEETALPDTDRLHGEPLPSPHRGGQALVWSASPSLERIHREFDEQIRAIAKARRLLEERLGPLQRHLWEQHGTVDQALKQLAERLKPLRQYLEGQGQNLERITAHLNSELKDRFEAFEQFLTEQRQILERAHHYLDEQPRPLAQYLEDQQRAIEQVFRDVEEQLEPFGRYLAEQQKLLEALAEPRVKEEFHALASYCGERQAALERYASSGDFWPHSLFTELESIYQKYRMQEAGKSALLSSVLEQTRQADLRLQDVLQSLARGRDAIHLPRVEAAS
jgi:hypothetical protein